MLDEHYLRTYHESNMKDNFVIENGILIQCEGTKYTKIPDGVRRINKDSLADSYFVEELYIPSTVEEVEIGALQGSSQLRKLIMPARFIISWDSVSTYRLDTKYSGNIDTSAIFWSFFASSNGGFNLSKLKEVVIFGEEKELDLSYFDWDRLQRYNQDIVLRIENEVTCIKLGDKVKRDSFSKQPITPRIYINNYVENVQIDAPKGWNERNILFCAPKANAVETTDNSVELTLSPRENWHDDTRWDCLIRINISAITYLYPVELSCYESEKHQGCKLLLLGNRIEDIPLEQLKRETYPSVVVWEDYDTVYNKLKAKGWTR